MCLLGLPDQVKQSQLDQPKSNIFDQIKQSQLDQPKSNTKRYGDRAFSVCSSKLWNHLPSDIKNAESIDSFNGLLKTHLLKVAYYV